MDADGKNVKRLTDTPGYDGGAFFSPDCTQIVWRASRPKGAELDDYKRLLANGLVRPTKLEIWVANADGSEAHQVTYLDAGSFAPSFFPAGKRLIFSSNYGDPKGREFDLWAIDVDGTGLERITWTAGFDGFPMFSPDGKRLAFASNRNGTQTGETDVFVARWVDVRTGAPAAAAMPSPTAAADRFRDDVRWLADDAREGRGVGTAGLDAARQLARRPLPRAGGRAGGRRRLLRELRRAGGGRGPAGHRGDARRRRPAGEQLPARRVLGDRARPPARWWPPATASSPRSSGSTTTRGSTAKGKIVVVRRFTPKGGRSRHRGRAPLRRSALQGVERARARRPRA